ncbi:hypothetical protein ACRALDRAFT_209894, partial [Sodiomyces alcalophilus JCM 7366]|uniref:uncharacterized protein n=1 Tax=Sodiomyces alcalophilus JCM 7366 TaxID=591952 RepID=UPI0039B6148F
KLAFCHSSIRLHLSAEANILFASESIFETLGYQPCEVQNKPCFEFIHPDEIPAARSVHHRSVLLDKAAVLQYARIRSRDGQWIRCECCFTVANDVLVACTSIYRQGEKSQSSVMAFPRLSASSVLTQFFSISLGRAIEAPQIRRLFSSSPRDPRYQMLEHLSPKFRTPPTEREPRAALILNRFTRTLTVMFATHTISSILGVRPDQIKDKSFYEYIQESCLPEAIRCLENAKANDSMAYLRFWYRDPRREDTFEADVDDVEDEDEDEDERHQERWANLSDPGHSMDVAAESHDFSRKMKEDPDTPTQTPLAFGAMAMDRGRGPSPSSSSRGAHRRRRAPEPTPSLELEAVVSCTSDGLVVVLRKARPPIPTSQHLRIVPALDHASSDPFAAPWGQHPIQPFDHPRGILSLPPPLYHPPPPIPSQAPVPDHCKSARGPPLDQLMRSIRDVAVFAWTLVGINGNLAAYERGAPHGEAQPPESFRMSCPGTDYQGARWPPRMDERWSQSAPTSPSTALPAAMSAPFGFGQCQQQQQQQQQRQRRQGCQPHQHRGWAVDELIQGAGNGNYTFAHIPPPPPATTSTRPYRDASQFQLHYHQPRHVPVGSSDLTVHGQQAGTGMGTGLANEKPTVSSRQDERMTGVDTSGPARFSPADQSFINAPLLRPVRSMEDLRNGGLARENAIKDHHGAILVMIIVMLNNYQSSLQNILSLLLEIKRPIVDILISSLGLVQPDEDEKRKMKQEIITKSRNTSFAMSQV